MNLILGNILGENPQGRYAVQASGDYQTSRQKTHQLCRMVNTPPVGLTNSVANTSGLCSKFYLSIPELIPNHYENISRKSKRDLPVPILGMPSCKLREEGSSASR